MLARRLESLLAVETAKTDLSPRMPDDMVQRFESLRGSRLLPVGRTKNATHLSRVQMAAAVLSTVTVRPGFAGLAATILSKLQPVGGAAASFHGCATLGDAVERLLEDPDARKALLEPNRNFYLESSERNARSRQSMDRTAPHANVDKASKHSTFYLLPIKLLSSNCSTMVQGGRDILWDAPCIPIVARYVVDAVR